jgi:Leucine-rich repeat (LRR) protein
MVGSYSDTLAQNPVKLIGKWRSNNRFSLVARNEEDSIVGYFRGRLSPMKDYAQGIWTNSTKSKQLSFTLYHPEKESFWNYIRRNRSLYEYKSINRAIKNAAKVKSIDVARQSLTSLPEGLSGLKNIESINLLGNAFTTFPPVLAKLTSLDEISLSSNMLDNVGSEIGNLHNLRILIMNFNRLKSLPKEIGNLTNLLYLEIGRNQLHTLPDEISNLTNLQELHIDGNPLSDEAKQKIRKLLPHCAIYF